MIPNIAPAAAVREAYSPIVIKLRIGNLSAAFYNLENAMNSSLRYGFFITKEMRVDLQQQQLKGTVPILYVFLARAGKTIREVREIIGIRKF